MINKTYNTLLIGGSESGKTQNYVKPTILNTDCSYIINDPAGEIFKLTGDYLKSKGISYIACGAEKIDLKKSVSVLEKYILNT